MKKELVDLKKAMLALKKAEMILRKAVKGRMMTIREKMKKNKEVRMNMLAKTKTMKTTARMKMLFLHGGWSFAKMSQRENKH